MKAEYACNSNEHVMERRRFLGTAAGLGAVGMTAGVSAFSSPAVGAQLASEQKRVVVFNMAGGLSQLERNIYGRK